jgi:hypothetical protein
LGSRLWAKRTLHLSFRSGDRNLLFAGCIDAAEESRSLALLRMTIPSEEKLQAESLKPEARSLKPKA